MADSHSAEGSTEHSTSRTSTRHHEITVPINTLPPEILAQIFHTSRCFNSSGYRRASAAEGCVHPATLSSVCTTWRHIALDLPWLWSHIDFATQWVAVTEGQSNHLRLMTERSLGESVELSMCVQRSPMIPHDHPGLFVTDPAIKDALAQLSDLLSPLAPRIRGLDIHSDVYAGPDLQTIFACTAKSFARGTLDMLVIHAKNKSDVSTRLLPWDPLRTIDAPMDAQMNELTETVKFVHLVNVSIDWSSNLYSGLTELAIIFTGRILSMSCSQMVHILSSCPQLRRLSLRGVYAIDWDGFGIEPKTVQLQHLRRIELQCSRPTRLAPLLKLLRPTNEWLYVGIWVGNEPEFVKQLHVFFEESSKVRALKVVAKNKTGWFASIREGLNDSLERLTLEDCDFADPDLAHFVGDKSQLSSLALWPRLEKLELTRCTVDIVSLEYLCAGELMEKVKFTDCKVRDPGSGDCSLPALSMFTPDFVQCVAITVDNGGVSECVSHAHLK